MRKKTANSDAYLQCSAVSEPLVQEFCMLENRPSPSTAAIHTERPKLISRPISSPIFQTSTFALPSAADLSHAAVEVSAPGFYTRHGNPNQSELAEAVATME